MATTRSADGTTIEYEESGTGEGPAVILVHGITESRRAWDPVAERLARDHRVIALDLRGHGGSGTAARYDLESMGGDVAAVAAAAGATRPHLVGHSLGGAVVSTLGPVMPVSSIVDVDQPLQLDGFKAQLMAVEDQLRDPAAFPLVIEAVFDSMAGEMLAPEERTRIETMRRPDQEVVLGVWELILSSNEDEIAGTVDAALAGYEGADVAYLALFGIDPDGADGAAYGEWLAMRIDGAVTEVWPDHGHYPHLVEPDRFVDLLHEFWDRA